MYYDSQNREIEDLEGDNMRQDNIEELKEKGPELMLEDWQLEAFARLMALDIKEVEEGQRVYTSTSQFGTGFYHLIDKRYNSLQIEQIDVDEKWNKRVNLYEDEIGPFLKTMLVWYLEKFKIKAPPKDDFLSDDALGDLDDHPF